MEAIGGYFELELRQGEHYHKDAIQLNTARNCFEYVLLARNYTKVYIPYYTCEVILQPLKRHGIAYEFYSISEELEPVEVKRLLPDEAFLYTNYFGLKQRCVEKLATFYGSRLIVDNAQAFFAPRLASIDTFYSPRKFFGVPDGGYLYTDCVLAQDFPQDKSYERMRHLLQRIDEGAESSYSSFRENDESLDDNPIRKMSKLTQKLLCNINYENIKEKRCKNFITLHRVLKRSNSFNCDIEQDQVPMVYPYYANNTLIKRDLIANKIFVATYWTNVLSWTNVDTHEYNLAYHLLSLPVDQRYKEGELERIIKIVYNENSNNRR